jgi:hypothetical protein
MILNEAFSGQRSANILLKNGFAESGKLIADGLNKNSIAGSNAPSRAVSQEWC